MEKFKDYLKSKVEKQKKIGSGAEKQVYQHPDKPDKVFGVYHPISEYQYEKSSEYNKAKFYLTNIIHMLFPENIPDVSMATTEPRTIIRGRIKPRKSLIMRKLKEADFGKKLTLEKALLDLGLQFDQTDINFLEDKNGNIVYVDDIYPWFVVGRRLYDPDKIRSLILQKLEGHEQDRALKYLERLEALFEQITARE